MAEILKVRLGEYDVSTTAEPLPHQEFNISDIRVHPNFNNATLVNDIALLQLQRPAKRQQVGQQATTRLTMVWTIAEYRRSLRGQQREGGGGQSEAVRRHWLGAED